VIFGPCAAGKTTYAHALARRENAVAFVLDEWGARLFGPDLQGPIEFAWMLERLGRCNALIWSTAEAVLAAGTSVVLEKSMSTSKPCASTCGRMVSISRFGTPP